MFQDILKNLHENISTVRCIIKTSDNLRDILDNQTSSLDVELLAKLRKDAPKSRDWIIYEHCATVTRLYAIYETFVENLLKKWLAILPRLYPNYSDLEERIRTTHQMGVGKLLIDLNKNRYSHLSITDVISGIFRGVSNDAGYKLIPDAFLIHEQNLRKEILDKLLADAGVSNAWNWLEKSNTVNIFLQNRTENENNAEGTLNQLIINRNQAAHGVPEDILDSNSLLELCDFVEALCEALAELMTFQVIERQKLVGQAKEIGIITEWFKKPQAAVAKIQEATLSIGTDVFLIGEASCQLAKIHSIKINDKATELVNITSETEVGLKFDIEAKKGLRIYQSFVSVK